ncbi:RagB/SusD family nutrient uptake outer membrane protein [Altibacter sp.]|uniref:RagB/SusD family nutrient uptake outer membrane protein n=1 Tax=Altibacter sp. TaxID=2024823 RepID=UPI000C93F8DE|nr:RagB/SusD family nutrient uptake outer membrane protein [Altibacter sp.]MAP55179.1 hypothetical protein [Altibacter sp.]
MKNILKFSIFIFATFSLVSCADDFVENNVEPVTSIPVTELIVDLQTAQAALNGIYAAAQNDGFFQGDAIYQNGLYSDELVHTGSFPSFAEFAGNDIATNNVENLGIWQANYDVIFDVNFFIAGIEAISGQLTAAQTSSFLGQARALRGVAYLNLGRLFGAVPVYLESPIITGDFEGSPRVPLAQVYEQSLADLNFAVDQLSSINADDGYFIGEYSARFFRAKLNTETGDYAAAMQDLNAIEGNFSLTSSYSQNFSDGIKSETIFKLDFSITDGNGLAFFFYPSSDGGRREVFASQTLIDAIAADGGSRGDLLVTVGNFDNIINKYDDTANGSDEVNVIRYADVLLYQAEVAARMNQFGVATTKVNQVRQRAGVAPVTVTAGNFRDILSRERLVEFYAEGHRWYDIKRLGVADQIIQDKPGSVFIPARMNLWPIPSDEIDTNSNISQADQNPGY